MLFLENPEFIADLMLASAPLTFVELLGSMFFEIAKGQADALAKGILSKSDISGVFKTKAYSELKASLEKTPSEMDAFNATFKLWRAFGRSSLQAICGVHP